MPVGGTGADKVTEPPAQNVVVPDALMVVGGAGITVTVVAAGVV